MRQNCCFYLLLIVCIMPSCYGSKDVIKSGTTKIVRKMAKGDGYYSQYVGYAGEPSDEYKNYEQLLKVAR